MYGGADLLVRWFLWNKFVNSKKNDFAVLNYTSTRSETIKSNKKPVVRGNHKNIFSVNGTKTSTIVSFRIIYSLYWSYVSLKLISI